MNLFKIKGIVLLLPILLLTVTNLALACSPGLIRPLEGNQYLWSDSSYILTLIMFGIGLIILIASIVILILKKKSDILICINIVYLIVNLVFIFFSQMAFAQDFSDFCDFGPSYIYNPWKFPYLLVYLKGYWNIILFTLSLIIQIISWNRNNKYPAPAVKMEITT